MRAERKEDVAAADDDDDLDAQLTELGDLAGHTGDGLGADAKALISAERFAGKFEEDAFVFGLGFGCFCHRRWFTREWPARQWIAQKNARSDAGV